MLTIRTYLQQDEDCDSLTLADEVSCQSEGSQERVKDDLSGSSSNLNSIQATPSLISAANLLRYWHTTHFFTRFAFLGVKHKSETARVPESIKPTRLCWLNGEGIPLEAWPTMRLASVIKDFFDSLRFIVGVEATLLAGLLLHDLISAGLFPEERCGTSISDIVDGMARNQVSWTYHFGSDVIHELPYWTGLGAVVIPPIAGLMAAFFQDRQRKLLRVLETQDVAPQLATSLSALASESLTLKKACLSLFPLSAFASRLAQVKFMLLWEGRKGSHQRLLIPVSVKAALVDSLIDLTESNYFLIRYQAMQLLTQVVASFHPENLDRFIEDQAHKAGLAQLRETVLAKLKKESMSEASANEIGVDFEATYAQPMSLGPMERVALLNNRQQGMMARYFCWTLGEDTRPATQLFWIPSLLISAYTAYSVTRYLQLMIKKLIDITYHFHDKAVCENRGYYFKFLSLSERYECIACDWSFVSYQHSVTTQACLQSLLQQKIRPVELLYYLKQLPRVREVTRIDFSQQAWPTWAVADWEQLLMSLPSIVTSPLELFTVSNPIESEPNQAPSRQAIEALARLLSRINVTRFEISHQRLNHELFSLLLEPLSQSTVEELNVVGTQMSDLSVTMLADLISNEVYFQHLNHLQLADNQISDLGLHNISEALPHSSLKILNLANNLLTDLGLQRFGQGIQPSAVYHLDLSGQVFSPNGLRLFSEGLKENSSLSVLKLSHAGLTGDHLAALQGCLESLESLDVSDNLLTSQEVQWILKTNPQYLKTLNVARNDLSQETNALMVQGLSMSSLQHLDLSGNALGRQGFKQLARALPGSQLLSLVCEEGDLDDQDMTELTQIFSNNTLLLRSLNVNKNKITEDTLLNWLSVLPQTRLRELHLNNNEIGNSNNSAPLLAQRLRKTNLTFLDLSNNLLDGDFFKSLAPVLPQSQLLKLSLSDNQLEANSVKQFAEALVQLPCHHHDLNATKLSRQMKRVFYPMKPMTELTQLTLIHDNLDASAIRSFCRVAASLKDVQFLQRNQLQQLDWHACAILPGSTIPAVRLNQTKELQSNQTQSMQRSTAILGSSFLIGLLCAGSILCFIALLYGAYRAGQSSYRFFRPAPLRLPRAYSESEDVVTNHHLRRASL